MIIAITGASGFLGINLVEELLKKDTNFILAFTSQKKTLENKFKNRHVYVFEREAFFKVQLKDVDVLINCAFPRNNDNRQMAVGLKYVNDVLNHAVYCGVKTVINISSQSVYSQKREHAADEYTELCLDSIYAVGKFASELLTNTICKNIRHTNIRLASLIGPDFDQRLVNKMIDNALARHKIKILSGSQSFGFMDVEDAVLAIISVVNDKEKHWNEVYNLGIKGGYSLYDIASCIKNNLIKFGVDVFIEQSEEIYSINSALSCDSFYNQFKFKPVNTLNDTVKKIIIAKLKNKEDSSRC